MIVPTDFRYIDASYPPYGYIIFIAAVAILAVFIMAIYEKYQS